jgi:hypothetical protein
LGFSPTLVGIIGHPNADEDANDHINGDTNPHTDEDTDTHSDTN